VSSKGSGQHYEWQIVDKVRETPDTYTYSFSPNSGSQRFNFNVGQSVTIRAFLRRPLASGKFEEGFVERAYSIASSPTRNLIDLTIKDEKPYGYINPATGKADGFAAYFLEQTKIGDKIDVRLNPAKNHFLWKIAAGLENDIAYWSGANGIESARCLIQYLEDSGNPDICLTLFYSNPSLHVIKEQDDRSYLNVIYYKWLIDMARKIEGLKVIFTFTRDKEILSSDHPRIIYRNGRFFVGPDGTKEKTLSKYHGNINNTDKIFNPICGSSGFINGIVKLPNGKIERGKGIMQDLMDIEGVKPENIDKEQYYLEVVGVK
jgi:ferredoxin-NADP reductase